MTDAQKPESVEVLDYDREIAPVARALRQAPPDTPWDSLAEIAIRAHRASTEPAKTPTREAEEHAGCESKWCPVCSSDPSEPQKPYCVNCWNEAVFIDMPHLGEGSGYWLHSKDMSSDCHFRIRPSTSTTSTLQEQFEAHRNELVGGWGVWRSEEAGNWDNTPPVADMIATEEMAQRIAAALSAGARVQVPPVSRERIGYDECAQAIGGDPYKSAAEMHTHVNFAIAKGLVALPRSVQAPVLTDAQIEKEAWRLDRFHGADAFVDGAKWALSLIAQGQEGRD